MGNPFCEWSLLFSTQISEHEELHSTYIATCVLNSYLCYSAVMLNCVAIYAIRKTSSLPKTLKTLLLSLAVSDVVLVYWVNHCTSDFRSCGYNKLTLSAIHTRLHLWSLLCFV